VRVAALAPGVVERLLVVENQAVKAGEPVAELIKEDSQLAYDRAQADLRLRQAELQQVQAAVQAAETRYAQPVHLEAALGEAQAGLAAVTTERKNLPYETRRAEAQLAFAESDYKNKQDAEGAIAGRVIEQARSELDAARALVEELHNRTDSLAQQEQALCQRCDALNTQLKLLADETEAKDESGAKLQAAAARVDQARVALAEAKLRLDRMIVRAPIDGRVYQLVGYPGSTLTAGMGKSGSADGSTVVTLYRPDMLQVRVDVRFEDIPKVSLGQPVEINNPALAAALPGKVLYVSSEADIQKNTLQVKVALDAPQPVFKPEMLVDVTFVAPKPADTVAEVSEEMRLYVPQQLVRQDEAGPFVWVADQSAGVARRTSITTGQASGGMVEVTAGLTLASRIITRGQEGLADGERIRVVSEESDVAAGAGGPPGVRQALNRLPEQGG
jgi:HlyD family secretion protein